MTAPQGKHNLGFAVGSVFVWPDGSVSFTKAVTFIEAFRCRPEDVTGFSETRGGKKRMEFTLHVFGQGGEMFTASVNGGTATRLERWFREHGYLQPRNVGPTAGAVSVADELAKLAALRDQGILTQAEFEAAKRRLLA